MIKQILIGFCVSLSLGSIALAQNAGGSSGPHDPNPPVNAPDLRLAPPCAPGPHIAEAPIDPAHGVQPSSAMMPAGTQHADTQCAGAEMSTDGRFGPASGSGPIKN